MAKPESEGCPDLDVTIYSKGDTAPSRLPSQKIAQIRPTDPKRLVSFDCDVAFIVVSEHTKLQLGCQSCRDALTRALSLPDCWWAKYRMNSHGYLGCEDTVDEQGVISGVRTWSRFEVKEVEDKNKILTYDWHTVDVYTNWRAATSETVIVAFAPQPPVEERLRTQLLEHVKVEHLANPFWMFPSILEEVVHLQDRAVWAIRDMVRATEKNRSLSQRPQPNYVWLHEIARHAIHVSESLDTGNCNFDEIVAQHDRIVALINARAGGTPISAHVYEWVRNRLRFLQSLLRSSRGRSISNKERLQNEIQLAFNVVTQYDTRVSVAIARSMQGDSASMRTIAFVTLAFLPATFICAIFSMSFFDYDSSTNEWAVSSEFWRYWVVAIPVTGLTTAAWYFWNRNTTKREAKSYN